MKHYAYRTAMVDSLPNITKKCCEFGKDGWRLSQMTATKMDGVGTSFILVFEKEI